MIVSSITKVDDMFEVEFDNDGETIITSIPHGASCWLELRKWKLAGRIKRPTDIVGMSVDYADVFGSEPDADDQMTVAKTLVNPDQYDMIAQWFDDWAQCPPGSHIAHHVHENDVGADGESLYTVWGCPYSIFHYWCSIEPTLKEKFPKKYWSAVLANKKDVLISFLRTLADRAAEKADAIRKEKILSDITGGSQ